jgi:hypothetical protein
MDLLVWVMDGRQWLPDSDYNPDERISVAPVEFVIRP